MSKDGGASRGKGGRIELKRDDASGLLELHL